MFQRIKKLCGLCLTINFIFLRLAFSPSVINNFLSIKWQMMFQLQYASRCCCHKSVPAADSQRSENIKKLTDAALNIFIMGLWRAEWIFVLIMRATQSISKFLLLINYKDKRIKLYTFSMQNYALNKSSALSIAGIQFVQSCINESKGGKFCRILDSLIISITIPYCDNPHCYCILFRDMGAKRTSQIFIRFSALKHKDS